MLFSATTQPEQAREFYAEALGLDFVADTPFALVFRVGNQQLRVQKVQTVSAPPYTSLGFQVANLASDVRELIARGVQLQRYPFLEQDEMGIWNTPDGAKIAWVKDPDGNVISFTEESTAGN